MVSKGSLQEEAMFSSAPWEVTLQEKGVTQDRAVYMRQCSGLGQH